MNVLMSTAAIGAAIIGEWFEGATVVWLFSLGIYLQNKSMDQTRKSIRNLMDMAPSMAVVKVGDDYVERPVEEVSVGQMIMVKDRKSTRLNSSHVAISYAVFCLKKKKETYINYYK